MSQKWTTKSIPEHGLAWHLLRAWNAKMPTLGESKWKPVLDIDFSRTRINIPSLWG